MGLKVYGVSQSRAFRVLWMVNELGIPFEHVPTHFQTDTKKEDFKKLNPNARVPVIDDDGTVVWESMAINLYLAKKYGKDLAPGTLVEEAHAMQWSFWVMTEIEKPLLTALFASLGMMGSPKDPEKVRVSFEEMRRPLDVLNNHLEGREWLLDERFTVADLNVASVLFWATIARLDLSPWPHAKAWLERCLGREAAAKVRK